MRDINRIPRILKLIEEAWLENPDLRLCQLIYIVRCSFSDFDLFHYEDDKLWEDLQKFIEPEIIVTPETRAAWNLEDGNSPF